MRKTRGAAFLFGFFFSLLLWIPQALAQTKIDQQISRPLLILLSLSVVAVIPIILIMMTSFVKISVVLALIRNALGTQQIPPNQVINGLAMILTIYIMIPVGMEAYRSAESVIERPSSQSFFSEATLGMGQEALEKGKEPIRGFLKKHANDRDQVLFFELAKSMRKTQEDKDSIKADDFLILIPSFVISELAGAFKIGFVIFLPFLVIDMVVANVLLSLGMFQLSPITVSLPFKLLLFVIIDGWYLIARGLILGYM